MSPNALIRMATEADAAEIRQIYSYYVTNTAVTFDYDAPSVAEFAKRIKNTMQMYPYLVAVDGERIVGYACASPFKERKAYSWAVETTIYIKHDYRGKGLGKKLYLTLEDVLKRQNIINMNACIAYTPVEDAYLSNTSMFFHEHLGYKKVAHFTKCGYKFGTWYDVIWMEKILGEHPAVPDPVIPISALDMSHL